MNIFALDDDPKLAAQYHCDVHVNKMITETAQMLSTTIRYYIGDGFIDPVIMQSYNPNHCCNRWIRQSKENFHWLMQLGFELINEYNFRYGKNKHQRALEILQYCESLDLSFLPQIKQTPFVLAMPEQYTNLTNRIKSYRMFYVKEKTFAKWNRGRDIPYWYDNYR